MALVLARAGLFGCGGIVYRCGLLLAIAGIIGLCSVPRQAVAQTVERSVQMNLSKVLSQGGASCVIPSGAEQFRFVARITEAASRKRAKVEFDGIRRSSRRNSGRFVFRRSIKDGEVRRSFTTTVQLTPVFKISLVENAGRRTGACTFSYRS